MGHLCSTVRSTNAVLEPGTYTHACGHVQRGQFVTLTAGGVCGSGPMFTGMTCAACGQFDRKEDWNAVQ